MKVKYFKAKNDFYCMDVNRKATQKIQKNTILHMVNRKDDKSMFDHNMGWIPDSCTKLWALLEPCKENASVL